jgi:CheY-like chemotaxis protein
VPAKKLRRSVDMAVMSMTLISPLAVLAGFTDQLHVLVLQHGFPLLVMGALSMLLVVLFSVHSVEAKVPEPRAEPQNETPPPGPSILLVDDSAVARAKLLRTFQAAGYRAVVARDGIEAMEALSSQFFSVLLTDLEMPRMNGFELIAWVQGSADTEDLPIIAITGHDELQARVHEFSGLYGIFKKPWNERELLRRVEVLAALRKPRAVPAVGTTAPSRPDAIEAAQR